MAFIGLKPYEYHELPCIDSGDATGRIRLKNRGKSPRNQSTERLAIAEMGCGSPQAAVRI
jgi:hypothetical protein